MNSDLDLVKYLLTCINSNELQNISDAIAPDVVIVDPICSDVLLEQYFEHIAIMVQHVESRILDIQQNGNVFHVNMVFSIVDNQIPYHSEFGAVFILTIKDSLLIKSELVFDAKEHDLQYLCQIKERYG